MLGFIIVGAMSYGFLMLCKKCGKAIADKKFLSPRTATAPPTFTGKTLFARRHTGIPARNAAASSITRRVTGVDCREQRCQHKGVATFLLCPYAASGEWRIFRVPPPVQMRAVIDFCRAAEPNEAEAIA